MSTFHHITRPIEQGDWNMAYLLPEEIIEARNRIGLVILPVAPLEWHGPHMAMGCDYLLAHAFARRIASELRCPYYPPLCLGTERERDPESLEAIGLDKDTYVEGMDFAKDALASGYYREEVFGIVLRNTLDILFDKMQFKYVIIISGHAAYNQISVISRLCTEYNGISSYGKRIMWAYAGFPRYLSGAIAHAGSDECSLLEATWPGCVDLSKLPTSGRLKNIAFAIVDAETFACLPTEDKTVRDSQDPRLHTDPEWGRERIEEATKEVIAEVRRTLLAGKGEGK